MAEDNTLNAVRDLMRKLNKLDELRATEQELIQRHTQLQHEVESKKEKKLEHLKDVGKRKQQKQIKTQKKQKTKNYTNVTTLSSNIGQEINIECDTSIGQSNINNIQRHDNMIQQVVQQTHATFSRMKTSRMQKQKMHCY